MTKSILPSSATHVATAFSRDSSFRTSMSPRPITLAPLRAVEREAAISVVLEALRPMMQALAPRWTRARTCWLQMVPPPPVQKTTLLSGERGG